MPYGITHCYLLPGRRHIPAFTPRLVLDLSTLEGHKAELTYLAWFHTELACPPEDGHPSQY